MGGDFSHNSFNRWNSSLQRSVVDPMERFQRATVDPLERFNSALQRSVVDPMERFTKTHGAQFDALARIVRDIDWDEVSRALEAEARREQSRWDPASAARHFAVVYAVLEAFIRLENLIGSLTGHEIPEAWLHTQEFLFALAALLLLLMAGRGNE
jgi:hypothetical protein